MKRLVIIFAVFFVITSGALAYRFLIMSPIPGPSSSQPTPNQVSQESAPQDKTSYTTAPVVEPKEAEKPLSMSTLLKEMLSTATSEAEGTLVTEPEKCILLGPPNQFAFLQKENLLLIANYGGIYAFDITSGNQVWHRYLSSTRGRQAAIFGRQKVLGWSDSEVFLLDPVTGHEIWRRDKSPCGAMESAKFSLDETQIAVSCTRGVVIYPIDSHSQFARPKVPDAWLFGWLPDNKTLLFIERKGEKDNRTDKLLFMDIDSGAVAQRWEWPASWNRSFPGMSVLGQFAEPEKEGDNSTSLTIRDAQTGNVIREFKGIPGLTGNFAWMRDAKRLFSVTSDKLQTRIIDAETGTVLFSLAREGHRFSSLVAFEDPEGNAWTFSQDEENNRYVWPLTPDSVPQKVLSGRHIAPGYFEIRTPFHNDVLCTTFFEEKMWEQTIYSLEDIRKIAQFRFHNQEQGWYGSLMDQAMNYIIRTYLINKDDSYSLKNLTFNVYVQNNDSPIHTEYGRPVAISPDGTYLVVQTDENTACLYHLASNKILNRYTKPARDNEMTHMYAEFSDNGKRMILNTSEALLVTDLTGDYPIREMDTGPGERFHGYRFRFTQDAARVLCGGHNTAWLFDTDTGALLHTFEETERYAESWSRGNGFFNSLARTAKDWVGRVTDQFKSGTTLNIALSEDGTNVITYAAGQVIRVWDAASGNLLNTIHSKLPEKRNKEGYINNQISISADGRYAFCYNGNGFGTATLWSLDDGTLHHRYQLPQTYWIYAVLSDDGSAVYISYNTNLYRWPGA